MGIINFKDIVRELVRRIKLGIPSQSIDYIRAQDLHREDLSNILQAVMGELGELWQNKQLALTQVVVAGMIAEDIAQEFLFIEEVQNSAEKPLVILGCIADDNHSLGKDLVKTFLSPLFEVRDLGVNVTPERFLNAAVQENASVIAVSALMMNAVQNIKILRGLIDAEKWVTKPLLVVGGAPFVLDPMLWERIGADVVISSAVEAPHLITSALQERVNA